MSTHDIEYVEDSDPEADASFLRLDTAASSRVLAQHSTSASLGTAPPLTGFDSRLPSQALPSRSASTPRSLRDVGALPSAESASAARDHCDAPHQSSVDAHEPTLTFPPLAQKMQGHARTVSLESSLSSGSSKRKSAEAPHRKTKRRHSGSVSQFKSASAILKATGLDQKEDAFAVGQSSGTKEQQSSTVKGTRAASGRLSIASTSSRAVAGQESFSSIEFIETEKPKAESSDDDGVLLGSSRHDSVEKKIGPTLITSIRQVEVSSDDEASIRQVEVSSDDEAMPAAARLRGGLLKFQYQADSVNASTSASASTSKATIAAPSKKTPRTKSSTLVKPPAVPVTLPADERIRLLNSCPLCLASWTASKTLSAKSVHLRNCAASNEFTSETVRVLVENQLIALANEVELRRRETEMGRSVFDRAVGKGEGANVLKEVTMVGIEGVDSSVEAIMLDHAQKELDTGKKRPARERVVKVAREIRKERRDAALLEQEQDQDQETARVPTSTGLLAPATTGSRRALALRADALIDNLGGTGLTQVDSRSGRSTPPRFETADPSDLLYEKQELKPSEMEEAGVTAGWPSTQVFEPSRIAGLLFQQDKTTVMTRPAKTFAPVRQDQQDSDDDESSSRSLWSAAGGKDDRTIRRVVLPSPASLDRSMIDLANSSGDLSADLTASSPRTNGHSSPVGSMADSPSVLRTAERMRTLGLHNLEAYDDAERDETENAAAEWMDEDDDDDCLLVWEGGHAGRTDLEAGREELAIERGSPGPGDREGAISSDEEPLVVTAARWRKRSDTTAHADKSDKPRRGNEHRGVSASPSITSPSESGLGDDAAPKRTDMPDYASQTLLQLQKQVKQYGYRVSKERSVLVSQLERIWSALHPDQRTHALPPLEIAVEAARSPSKTARKLPRKGRKAASAPAAPPDDPDSDDGHAGETVGERLRVLLLAHDELYHKILRYEPIFFDEAATLAAENGLKAAKALLMRCLDEQCITYYTQDPTNGSRRRHK